MKKKIIITTSIFLILAIIIGLIFFIFNNQDNNKVINENIIITNMAQSAAMNTSKPSVVFFHSPMCGYCVNFVPIFNALAKSNSDKYNFVAVDITIPENQYIARGNIPQLPALYIYDTEIGNKITIAPTSFINEKTMQFELDRYSRMRSYMNLDKAKKDYKTILDNYKK